MNFGRASKPRVESVVGMNSFWRDRSVFVTVRGEITDRDLLERVLGEYEVEVVFHVAAQAIVGIANRDPASTFSTNIEGTWNLLEACRPSPDRKSTRLNSS